MGLESVNLKLLENNNNPLEISGTRVHFSPFQLLHECAPDEAEPCWAALGQYLAARGQKIAIFGQGALAETVLRACPELIQRSILTSVVVHKLEYEDELTYLPECKDLRKISPEDLSKGDLVFIAEEKTFEFWEMRKLIPKDVKIIEPNIIGEIETDLVPLQAWVPIPPNIYPLEHDIPKIKFSEGLDLILMDCPSRNLSIMPNGLGYVHNALEKTEIKFQTFDLDIVAYHRFHIHRLYDLGSKRIILPSKKELPDDPWRGEWGGCWTEDGTVEYFSPLIEETADAIEAARPKMLGLSVQGNNRLFSKRLAKEIRSRLPNIIIIIGGYDCINPTAAAGRAIFTDADYIFVGEADHTVGPITERIAKGELPKNEPGVISRFDDDDYKFVPAPMPHNLGAIEWPKYQWVENDLYRNHNGYNLTPVIATRGCLWSRCTFCSERFYWRSRAPEEFVDELEWHVNKGRSLFVFNESDLNGQPEKLLAICDEIIKRGIKTRLTGQLRINKKSDKAFFLKLREAGFTALRFGVDAFSKNTLKLQKKGYTMDMIAQNLRDCKAAGIGIEVNWVVGVPHETEEDLQEGIDFLIENKDNIDVIANLTPLLLNSGSVYWEEPEKHGIKFRMSKESLFALNFQFVPDDQWYSVDPYIDADIRKEWVGKILHSLQKGGVPLGDWVTNYLADRVYEGDVDEVVEAKPEQKPERQRMWGA